MPGAATTSTYHITAPMASVDVFDIWEASATADTASTGINPFTDLSFTGEFVRSDSSEEHIPIEGFCDSEDGRVFRIRFLPLLSGPYSYRLTLRHGDTILAEHAGTFQAHAGAHQGLVRVDREHPWHFVYEGTNEHFFYNGTTAYFLLGWEEARFEPILDRLHRLGVNRIRVALCGRVESGRAWHENIFESEAFRFKLNPWVAERPDSSDDPGFDVTRFHVAHWQKADRLLTLARERGIQVSVIFYVDGARKGTEPFGKERAGGEDERRYYRYAVARLAAHANVMWDVTNEYRLFRDDDWAKEMGGFLKAIDPYGHLISVHGHGTFTFRTEPWADYALFQSWDEHGGNRYMIENRRLQEVTGRPIPQVNEEYGYEDHYPQGWGENRVAPARSSDTRRRLAWEIAMAGCYQTTGESAEPCGGWINGRGCADSTEMLLGNARIVQFFQAFDWWRCEPHNDLAQEADAFCLAEQEAQYAVWLPQGGPVSLALPSGRYRARWFHPRDDVGFGPAWQVDHAGREWTSPLPPEEDGRDWALLLVRAE